jgi:hypothetical protein
MKSPLRRATAIAATFAAVALVVAGVLAGGHAANGAHPSVVPIGAATHTSLRGHGGDGDDHGNVEGAPNVCAGCAPPMTYSGGPVMGTQPTANGQVTQPGVIKVTPIYWSPTSNPIPATYSTIINRYITDLAADSGKTTNPFAVVSEYSAPVNGVTTRMQYSVTAGTPITDTTAFPASGCTATATTFTTCLTATQIRAELNSLLTANSLTPSLGQIYVIMFPPNVETFEAGLFSGNVYCGIHQSYVNGAGQDVVYSDEPYDPGCNTGEAPDLTAANISDGTYPAVQAADGQVSTIQHEVLEADTDPSLAGVSGYTDPYAWGDKNGQEIGDECSWEFGNSLGSTLTGSNASLSQYNSVINGDKYYTQLGYSNQSLAAAGDGRGCLLGAFGSPTAGAAARVRALEDAAGTGVGATTVNTSEADLPADGASTATITVTVTDGNGDPISGDDVHFGVTDANQGEADAQTISSAPTDTDTGTCGAITPNPDSLDGSYATDANGQVFATYTASTDNGACSILATEATGGTANDTVIFQGSSDDDAPSITQSSPSSLTADGAPVTFTATAQNPAGAEELDDTQDSVFLSGDDTGSTIGLDASQVTLSYSDDATSNEFVPVALTGTTVDGGYIEGDIDPTDVTDFPPGSSEVVTFKLTVATGAADSVSTGTPLTIESDLDQLNEADGSTSNVSYDYADAFVLPAATTPPTSTTTTPTTTTTTITEPTKTIVVVVPVAGAAAKPQACVVPNLKGKNVAQVQTAVNKAKCASVTLIEPKLAKGQKLVFSTSNPKRGQHLATNHTLKITFKVVKPAKKKK